VLRRSAIPPLRPVRAQGSPEELVVEQAEYPEGVGEASAVLRLQGDGEADQPVVKMAHQAGLEVQGDPDLIFSHHAGRTQLAALFLAREVVQVDVEIYVLRLATIQGLAYEKIPTTDSLADVATQAAAGAPCTASS